jgi:MFS family permease
MKKREILSLTFFFSLILIIIMDNALLLPNEVLIAADLDINFDLIGIILGLYTIVHGGSILVFGYYTDKIPRKKLLIISGLTWSISVMFYIFIQEFWQLIIGRIIAAIATGITAPLVISYLSDVISSDSRSKFFAFWGLISTLASLIAGVLALTFNLINFDALGSLSIPEKINYIILNYSDLLYTWKLPYFLLGIIALLLTLMNLFITIEPERAAKDKQFRKLLETGNYHYSYKVKLSDLKYIFKRKSNFFLILNFFDVVASGLLIAYIFPYIELEIGVNVIDLHIIILLLIAGVFGLILGQFLFAHWGDKKVQKGDINGRVKVAVICSILTLPFLLGAFSMTPNIQNLSFFFGVLLVNEGVFWIIWVIYCLFLGIGLAFTMGIAPNWYSSLIDVNFPENRGTMVAMGSFIDTIGRSLGIMIGGFMVVIIGNFSSTIFYSTLIFGLLSILFWVPLFYTSKKDLEEVNKEMENRAKDLKESF